MASGVKTWVLTGSLDNFRATREHGFKLIGAKEGRRRMAEQIEPGDRIVFYVTGVQALGGIVRVTGETSKFDGPYYMLRVISRAVRWHMPIPRFGRAEAPVNVVPVDFIIDAMTTADDVPELAGSTLHLVDPEPVSAAQVFDILAKEYAGRATGSSST